MGRRAIFAALLGGITVGLWARGLDHVPIRTVHWFTALGAPWLAVAFVLGAYTKARRDGAIAGGAALAIGVAVYYATFHFVEHKFGVWFAIKVGTGWALVALPIGAAFGWAGAAWRERRGPIPTAVLAGALLGEALLLQSIWSRPVAVRMLVLEAAVGLACALLLTRHRLQALAATAVVAAAVVVAELTAREALRAVGWVGA